MGKNILKNYIYNFGYQMLVILLPLITAPYVSRVLGADGVGIYGYTNSITQYFILFGALGLNLYGQREIAYKQKDKEGYTKVFKEIVVLKALCLTLSIVIYIAMSLAYTRYTMIFLLKLIDIVAAIIDISWFFQGLEEFKKIVIRNFIVKISGVALIFGFVKEPSDLYIYVLCYSATLFLGNLSMWMYIPKLIAKGKQKLDIRKHFKPALTLFIPQLSISIYTLLDKTMIGALTGNDAEVGFYDQSEKIIKLLLTVITSFGTVMMPRIASVFSENKTEQIQRYMNKTFRFVLVIAIPICFGVIGISGHFVPWFFGPGYDKVAPNMMIVAPIIIFIGMSNVVGTQYLLPTKRQKEYTISVVAGSVINFFVNIMLIPPLKSYGAAIATVIAEFTVAAIQLYFVRKDFEIRRIGTAALKYTVFSCVMLVVIEVAGSVLSDTFITTVIQVAAGMAVYLILLLITKDSFLREALDMIKGKVFKR